MHDPWSERTSSPPLHRLALAAMAAVAAIAAGCATTPPPPASGVFFPPPPEPPRIQFLTSYSGSKDVETQSAFDRFVVGEKQNLEVDKPYGVAVHDGKIYVCDTNATVAVFDLKGKTFGALKGAVGEGRLVAPVNISVDAEGAKFVADPGRGQVVEFDRDDAYVRAFAVGGGWRPVDAVHLEGRVYVADSTKAKVWVLDRHSGEVVKSIGDQGPPEERLSRPTNLAFDAEKNLYVSDAGRFQVVKYDRDGHFKATIGTLGDNPGHFARPKGIAVDREGRLYAVDAAFNNVQVFNPAGRLLLHFGGGGATEGRFLLPAKVAIDYDNVRFFQPLAARGFQIEYLILVTGQFGERLVNVLAYGREKGRKYATDDQLLRDLEEARKKEAAKQPPPGAEPPKPVEKPPVR